MVNHVLSRITPSSGERAKLKQLVFKVKALVEESLLAQGVSAEVVVGGSFARGTYLAGVHDVDFFVRFSDEAEMKMFPKVIISVFPEAVVVKGSRDYFRVEYEGYELEFIPVLWISDASEASNSMDASYFHIEYVNARLNDYLRNEVLLLKQFCKACGVYGAESYINGFSGYVIELLIIHFGGFKQLLKVIDKSPGELFIDLEGFYDSVSNALTALRVVPDLTPVVIVDPVLPTRNAAAGLSKQSFQEFILQARLFLRDPSLSFFRVEELSVSDLRDLAQERGHPLFVHEFEVDGKPDVFFAKLRRELGKVKQELERHDFVVYDYGFLLNGFVFFELERDLLPRTKRVIGPPVSIMSEHFDKFIDRDAVNGPYLFDGRVCFDVKREYRKAKPLLFKLLRGIEL